jgi:hypothetical protein
LALAPKGLTMPLTADEIKILRDLGVDEDTLTLEQQGTAEGLARQVGVGATELAAGATGLVGMSDTRARLKKSAEAQQAAIRPSAGFGEGTARAIAGSLPSLAATTLGTRGLGRLRPGLTSTAPRAAATQGALYAGLNVPEILESSEEAGLGVVGTAGNLAADLATQTLLPAMMPRGTERLLTPRGGQAARQAIGGGLGRAALGLTAAGTEEGLEEVGQGVMDRARQAWIEGREVDILPTTAQGVEDMATEFSAGFGLGVPFELGSALSSRQPARPPGGMQMQPGSDLDAALAAADAGAAMLPPDVGDVGDPALSDALASLGPAAALPPAAPGTPGVGEASAAAAQGRAAEVEQELARLNDPNELATTVAEVARGLWQARGGGESSPEQRAADWAEAEQTVQQAIAEATAELAALVPPAVEPAPAAPVASAAPAEIVAPAPAAVPAPAAPAVGVPDAPAAPVPSAPAAAAPVAAPAPAVRADMGGELSPAPASELEDAAPSVPEGADLAPQSVGARSTIVEELSPAEVESALDEVEADLRKPNNQLPPDAKIVRGQNSIAVTLPTVTDTRPATFVVRPTSTDEGMRVLSSAPADTIWASLTAEGGRLYTRFIKGEADPNSAVSEEQFLGMGRKDIDALLRKNGVQNLGLTVVQGPGGTAVVRDTDAVLNITVRGGRIDTKALREEKNHTTVQVMLSDDQRSVIHAALQSLGRMPEGVISGKALRTNKAFVEKAYVLFTEWAADPSGFATKANRASQPWWKRIAQWFREVFNAGRKIAATKTAFDRSAEVFQRIQSGEAARQPIDREALAPGRDIVGEARQGAQDLRERQAEKREAEQRLAPARERELAAREIRSEVAVEKAAQSVEKVGLSAKALARAKAKEETAADRAEEARRLAKLREDAASATRVNAQRREEIAQRRLEIQREINELGVERERLNPKSPDYTKSVGENRVAVNELRREDRELAKEGQVEAAEAGVTKAKQTEEERISDTRAARDTVREEGDIGAMAVSVEGAVDATGRNPQEVAREVREARARPVDREAPTGRIERKRDTITVNGVERSRTNSDGKPLGRNDTEIANFWRWFGDSKVVDEQGKPLVVYHGTESAFDTFKDGVAYFTPDTRYSFVQRSGQVIPAYIRIDNPLFATDKATQVEQLRSRPDEAAAIAEEHDGVIWAKKNDLTRGASGWGDDFAQFVVFKPTQVKSATGNRGTFDPADPNMTFALGRQDPLLRDRENPAAEATPQEALRRGMSPKALDLANRGETPFARALVMLSDAERQGPEAEALAAGMGDPEKAEEIIRAAGSAGDLALRLERKIANRDGISADEELAVRTVMNREINKAEVLAAGKGVVERWNAVQKSALANRLIKLDRAIATIRGVQLAARVDPVNTPQQRRELFVRSVFAPSSDAIKKAEKMRKAGKFDEARTVLDDSAAEEGRKALEKLQEFGYTEDDINDALGGSGPDMGTLRLLHDVHVARDKASLGAAIHSFYVNKIFSLNTLGANIMGGAAMAAASAVEGSVKAAVADIYRAFGGKSDRNSLADAPAIAKSLVSGMMPALRDATIALVHGHSETDIRVGARRGGSKSTVERQGGPRVNFFGPSRIGRIAAGALSPNTRLLEFHNELTKALSYRAALTAAALRKSRRMGLTESAAIADLVAREAANPSPEVRKEAFEYANEMTFQEDISDKSAVFAPLIAGMEKLRDMAAVGEFRPLALIIPFLGGLARVTRQGVRRTPLMAELALLSDVVHFKFGRREGSEVYNQLIRSLTGWGVYLLVTSLKDEDDEWAVKGFADWNPFSNETRRASENRENVTVYGYRFDRLDPLMFPFAGAAALRDMFNAEGFEAGRTGLDRLGRYVAKLGTASLRSRFFDGVRDLMETTAGQTISEMLDTDQGEENLRRFTGSVTRTNLNPWVMTPYDGLLNNFRQWRTGQVNTRRGTQEPVVSVYGEVAESDVWWREMLGFPYRGGAFEAADQWRDTIKYLRPIAAQSEVGRKARALRGAFPGKPRGEFTWAGQDVKLTDAEETRLQRYAGSYFMGRLTESLGDPRAWKNETDPVNAAAAVRAIQSLHEKAVKDARAYIMYEIQYLEQQGLTEPP